MRKLLRLRPRRVNSLSLSMVIAAAGAGVIIGGSFLTAHSLGASVLTSASHERSASVLSSSSTTRALAVPTAGSDDMTPVPLIVGATPAAAVDNDNEATEPGHDNDASPEPGDDRGGVQPTTSASPSVDDHGDSRGGSGSSGGSGSDGGSGGSSGSGDNGGGH
jgi:uncharacterized membrane protein YgcG